MDTPPGPRAEAETDARAAARARVEEADAESKALIHAFLMRLLTTFTVSMIVMSLGIRMGSDLLFAAGAVGVVATVAYARLARR